MVTHIDIEVPGGRLHVGRWGEAGSPAVLLLHGVTSSHMFLVAVAEALSGALVLAPDLRGRGASSELPGPYGMARHVDDVVALLDAEGIDRAVVVGHSMGGFISVVLAHRHPDRVSRLLLVDGGPPLPIPPGMSADAALQAVVGPAIDRLAMTFPNWQAYHEFWQAHPAFVGNWSALLEAYVDYDLVGEPPHLHSRTNAEAVQADAPDFFVTGPTLPEAMANLRHPATLLLAERGMLNATPLYQRGTIDEWVARLPNLTARTVQDVNHYTIVLEPRCVAEVVAETTAALAATTS